MTCAHCIGASDFFNERKASRDLRNYRAKGVPRTTGLLLDGLQAETVEDLTLLDIGGGVGVLQHELVARGVAHVINVDASPAYQAATRDEALRRGIGDRFEYREGDFVELAPDVPEADVVTLDRVLCCYPDADALLDAGSSRARRTLALSFPREAWFLKVAFGLVNLAQRIRRQPFRIYLHSTDRIRQRLESAGFVEVHVGRTIAWQARVFHRVEPQL